MMNALRRVHRDEGGVALIMAMMVAFVVLLLSIYVLGQATHNQQQAAYDRDRLTAANAAEAGLDWWYQKVQNTVVENLPLTAYTGSVISGPNTVSFTATPTFYKDDKGSPGQEWPVNVQPTATDYPKSVKIVSVGTASDGSTRTMETFMALLPVYGGFDGALIANSNTTFTNNFTVNGNAGNDGDIVILNGNFDAPSGLVTVKGSIYVGTPGYYANIGTQLHVYGQVWAAGQVTINHPQALVDLDTKSTSFPHVQYDQSAWQSLGYTLFKTFTDCTSAENYVESSSASTNGTYNADAPLNPGGIVVRITANCDYINSNNFTLNMASNLAIVTDGGIDIGQKSTWNGVSGTKSLYFIHAWPSSGTYPCFASNPDQKYETGDVYLGQLTSFDTHVQTSVYTPCEALMLNNNSAFQGQVIGGTMTVGNLFNMNYRPVLIPGAKVTGFKEDVAYIREVSS
jgi:Tfp pilus assembly protein PilX